MERTIQSLGSSAVFITLALTLEMDSIYNNLFIGLSTALLIFSIKEYHQIKRKKARSNN